MPSVLHETLVRLFRSRCELAPALLRICQSIALRHDHPDPGSIDLSQVASTGYRADAVTVLKDGNGAAVSAIIVEVQLAVDGDKRFTWPVYVAALRAELRCPVYLLVIAEVPGVARWARSVIDLGHPDFRLRPIVVDFDHMPRSVDPGLVGRLPEFAVLSAIAHPELEPTETALEAIQSLPEDEGELYCDVILSRLPDAVRRALEHRMRTHEYQSDFARKYFGQGREEGREEGLRAAVEALVGAKLGEVSPPDAVTIAGLRDQAVLTELITALVGAHTAQDVRAVLDRAVTAARSSPT